MRSKEDIQRDMREDIRDTKHRDDRDQWLTYHEVEVLIDARDAVIMILELLEEIRADFAKWRKGEI